MRTTALYHKHKALGARMIDFAGWRMPGWYESIIKEHLAVRESVGLFDIAHMGRIEVSGPNAYDFLQYVMTFDVSRIAIGEAHYSLMCYADGTVVDDLFIYRFPDHYLLVVNAANREKDMRWLLYHCRKYDVRIRDVSESLYMLSLQGPQAEAVLQQITDVDLNKLEYRCHTEAKIAGVSSIVARTGYTGEDGFELFFPIEYAEVLWDKLLEVGNSYRIKPVGLGARDTLRLEVRFALYGHELSPEINPYEARLGWVVNLDKPEFVGKEALLKIRLEGIRRRLIGFEVEGKRIARQGFPIYLDKSLIGFVTSGMYSPTLKKSLGLGYVTREFATIGTLLSISIGNHLIKATVVRTPFYEPKKKR